VTVRLAPFAPKHLSAMSDLWVATWALTYPAIDFEARRGWFVDRIGTFARDGIAIILAFSGEALAGFITVDRRSGWIDQMLVGTAFQGSDTAPALIAEAKRLSPAGLSLDVNADNARAIRFYGRQGFAKTGTRASQGGALIDLMGWGPPHP
jgi:putative acetyltransferase